MNLDELRSVQRTERQKDSLQHLRDSFYRDVADYIEELKAEREQAAEVADDPFSSPEVGRLTDEIETAEEVVESIYERRVGKVVKRATFAAADMAADENGLTSEEQELFDDLVARIKQNRQNVLDTLAGKYADDESDAAVADSSPEPSPSPPDAPPTPSPETETDAADADGGLLADAMGGDGADDASSAPDDTAPATSPPAEASAAGAATEQAPDAPTDETERTTVRITRDVGEIFGVDEREYELASEDVVTLPAANADPLLERDAAERLE